MFPTSASVGSEIGLGSLVWLVRCIKRRDHVTGKCDAHLVRHSLKLQENVSDTFRIQFCFLDILCFLLQSFS